MTKSKGQNSTIEFCELEAKYSNPFAYSIRGRFYFIFFSLKIILLRVLTTKIIYICERIREEEDENNKGKF